MAFAVPFSVILSSEKAYNDPILNKVFTANEDLYSEANYENAFVMVLITFLLFER